MAKYRSGKEAIKFVGPISCPANIVETIFKPLARKPKLQT
jgi:hypothetical protein